jgi:hypothetical protein
LWNSQRVCVYIGEDRLVICQVAGRWRPRVLDKAVVTLAPGEAPAVALDAWLKAQPPLTGSALRRLAVVLGLPHVRYLLLPWSPQRVQGGAFRAAMARALFSRQFQEDASLHEVRYGPESYGQPQLAAFVSNSLLQALAMVAQRHGGHLESAEPLLMSVWNRFSARLGGDGGVLVAESTRLLLVQREAGAITDVQVRPCSEGELESVLQRFAATPAARCFAPRHAALSGQSPSAWLGLAAHEGFSPAADGESTYALCGVLK